MAKPKRPAPKNQPPLELPPVSAGGVVDITAEQLLKVAGRVKILDCRSAGERRLGTILGAIGYDPKTFEYENRKAIPVVCVSWFGRRSKVTAYWLAKQGYTVYHLAEGMAGWLKKGYPRVRDAV